MNPADVATQGKLATAYMEQGRMEDAERILNGVVAIEPSNAAAHNALGVLAIQRHDGAAARSHFEMAVELDPDLVEAHFNLGLLYKMAGDKARARTSFEQFLAKAPPSRFKEQIPNARAALAELQ
jgi:superkiller protein 3